MASLKERLAELKDDLKSRRGIGDIIFLKDGETRRVRILSMGEENEFIKEVEQFYLGSEIKGVISPNTFGEPCAIYEGYQELKNSESDSDKELASKFSPKKKYLAFCLFYKDKAGKELDEELSPRFVMLTSGMYQEIIELYLDEDDWGDMTDPENGYDLKLIRTGKGLTDTEYSVIACKNTPIPKAYRRKVYDLDEEVRKIMPTYEETEKFLNKYLGLANKEEDDDDAPKKKNTKKKLIRKKKDLD